MDGMFYGNTVAEWLVGAAIVVVSYLVLSTLKIVVHRRLLKWAKETETDIDDLIARMLGRTKRLFLAVCSLYIGSLALELPGVEEGLRSVFAISLLAQGGLWSNSLIDWAIKRRVREEYEAGRKLMAMGRHTEAVPHFAEAVRLDPGYADAHYRLGLAYVQAGDYKSARRTRVKLAKLDADLANLLAHLIEN